VATEDGRPLFCGKDVAIALGYKDTANALKQHCKGVAFHHPLDTPGGIQQIRFITEGDLYRLVFNSKLPTAEKFEAWVVDEVLPTIRRHGMYAAPDTIEKMLADPDTMITVLEALKAERAKRAELESENAAQKQALAEVQPKVSYYDLVITSHDAVPVTNIAKEYGMSARKLNAKLHELGVQYRVGGKRNWVLTAKYQGHGYTDTKTHVIDQGNHTVIHTYWTQKGRLFLYDLLKQHGILPEIERGEAA
jgi:prophage antirepressor-like protein